jgi:hypothetical protein
MQIRSVRTDTSGDRIRISAEITWEDCDRPSQEVYLETEAQFADALTPDAHPFLIAAILPAMRRGERRIAVDGEICPQLRLGLGNAMRLVRHWYGGPAPVVIDAKTAAEPKSSWANSSAFFFTGGVDSLTTLRMNRTIFAHGHPSSFRDGLIIYGLEVDRIDGFNHVLDVLRPFAERSGITVIPIYTNLRSLDDDWVFWADQFESSVLSAVAQAFDRRLSSAWIASSYDYAHLHPHGSHPLLDPHYSSQTLRIVHDGVGLSRLEKVRILSDWPDAIRSLHVCNRSEYYRPGIVNCGTCEKCLRTLAALITFDRLDDAHSFASRSLTVELLAPTLEITAMTYPFWSELIEPLHRKGYNDVTGLVQKATTSYQTGGGWKGKVERVDQRYLGGFLLKVRDTLSPDTPP